MPTSTSRPPVPLPWQYLTASSALKKGVRICIYALTANQSHPCQVWLLREILKDIEVKTAKARCSCINDWGEFIAESIIASALLKVKVKRPDEEERERLFIFTHLRGRPE